MIWVNSSLSEDITVDLSLDKSSKNNLSKSSKERNGSLVNKVKIEKDDFEFQ